LHLSAFQVLNLQEKLHPNTIIDNKEYVLKQWIHTRYPLNR